MLPICVLPFSILPDFQVLKMLAAIKVYRMFHGVKHDQASALVPRLVNLVLRNAKTA